MGIKIEVRENGDRTDKFLKRASKIFDKDYIFRKYGDLGVESLRKYTPKDSGKTAESWSYSVTKGKDSVTIEWSNSNLVDGWCNIAVILQYGHGTGTGGYVQGTDYINPAMKPIFQKIADDLWEEVKK